MCVCSLVYPARKAHAPIILSSVACPTAACFSTLSHQQHDFRKKNCSALNKCFGFLYGFCCEIFLILSRNEPHVVTDVRRSSCKVPLLFVRCVLNLNFVGAYLIVKPTHAHFQFLFIKIYLKFLKILLHVSVIRPSSGSF